MNINTIFQKLSEIDNHKTKIEEIKSEIAKSENTIRNTENTIRNIINNIIFRFTFESKNHISEERIFKIVCNELDVYSSEGATCVFSEMWHHDGFVADFENEDCELSHIMDTWKEMSLSELREYAFTQKEKYPTTYKSLSRLDLNNDDDLLDFAQSDTTCTKLNNGNYILS